jgi:hypothetical protein
VTGTPAAFVTVMKTIVGVGGLVLLGTGVIDIVVLSISGLAI